MRLLPLAFPLYFVGLFSTLASPQQQAGVAQRDAAAVSQGTLTDSTGQSSSITIETVGTNQLRYDIGTSSSFVSNNGNGFLILQGKRHALALWDVKYRRAEHLPAVSLLADYQNANLQIKYIGLEIVKTNSILNVTPLPPPPPQCPQEKDKPCGQ